MTAIRDVTGKDFASEVLQSTAPVLVDFWAEWCGPCRQLSPTIKALAEDYAGRIKVAKVDADANPELAAQYNVRALPTVLFIKDGQVRDALVGNQPKAMLQARIESLL